MMVLLLTVWWFSPLTQVLPLLLLLLVNPTEQTSRVDIRLTLLKKGLDENKVKCSGCIKTSLIRWFLFWSKNHLNFHRFLDVLLWYLQPQTCEDSMLLTHDVSAFAFQCIYSKPGDSLFTCSTCAAVLHHNQSPEFYDEVRRRLASHLSSHRNVGVKWITEHKPRLREVMNSHKKSTFTNYLSRWSLLLLRLEKVS